MMKVVISIFAFSFAAFAQAEKLCGTVSIQESANGRIVMLERAGSLLEPHAIFAVYAQNRTVDAQIFAANGTRICLEGRNAVVDGWRVFYAEATVKKQTRKGEKECDL